MATPTNPPRPRKAEIQQNQAQATDMNASISNVRALAAEVLGSAEAAEQWFMAPAMGLDQRRPIALMGTVDDIARVTQLLSRIRYGVYA